MNEPRHLELDVCVVCDCLLTKNDDGKWADSRGWTGCQGSGVAHIWEKL